VVPSYVFVLLAPGSLPFLAGMGFVVGYGWVVYRFGLWCISFLDRLEVFLQVVLRVCLFTVRGFFLRVARLWRLFGSLDSGL